MSIPNVPTSVWVSFLHLNPFPAPERIWKDTNILVKEDLEWRFSPPIWVSIPNLPTSARNYVTFTLSLSPPERDRKGFSYESKPGADFDVQLCDWEFWNKDLVQESRLIDLIDWLIDWIPTWLSFSTARDRICRSVVGTTIPFGSSSPPLVHCSLVIRQGSRVTLWHFAVVDLFSLSKAEFCIIHHKGQDSGLNSR